MSGEFVAEDGRTAEKAALVAREVSSHSDAEGFVA